MAASTRPGVRARVGEATRGSSPPSPILHHPQSEAIVMRYLVLLATLPFWSGWASAELGSEWQSLDSKQAARVSPVQGAIESYARKYKPTAIMVVQDGLVVATSGDIARKVNVRSVRKSFLSALYGIAIERGQIKLESTLEQLRIDDTAPSSRVPSGCRISRPMTGLSLETVRRDIAPMCSA
ncbi:hypothetical protein L6654_17915 [Bradyrhizobium sp. WYCCWR 13023]|uniref:Beta-lactamase-related domain-containing protein n=1 Tax=Bradyrhizobium zhengyangense TaxID=2911009 RepID=A0A9X1U801_9BRAD|nr:hypothetical protein [Bradyrhizobium zhengyangense]MCG2628515.1 hypothetical protein [Bradyrhizobium zhengyangense]MCG2665371.1 hypothetical protein [Bradyrhizobium zhengyangense]